MLLQLPPCQSRQAFAHPWQNVLKPHPQPQQVRQARSIMNRVRLQAVAPSLIQRVVEGPLQVPLVSNCLDMCRRESYVEIQVVLQGDLHAPGKLPSGLPRAAHHRVQVCVRSPKRQQPRLPPMPVKDPRQCPPCLRRWRDDRVLAQPGYSTDQSPRSMMRLFPSASSARISILWSQPACQPTWARENSPVKPTALQLG